MPRHDTSDELKPVNVTRWLVVRDGTSRWIEYRELLPGADLRSVLEHERTRKEADGWCVREVSRTSTFCFAHRGDDQICLAIESYEPQPFLARRT